MPVPVCAPVCALSIQFERLGINANDPRFGVWMSANKHLNTVHTAGKYNQLWDRFLSTNPSTSAVFQKAKELGDAHGFRFNF